MQQPVGQTWHWGAPISNGGPGTTIPPAADGPGYKGMVTCHLCSIHCESNRVAHGASERKWAPLISRWQQIIRCRHVWIFCIFVQQTLRCASIVYLFVGLCLLRQLMTIVFGRFRCQERCYVSGGLSKRPSRTKKKAGIGGMAERNKLNYSQLESLHCGKICRIKQLHFHKHSAMPWIFAIGIKTGFNVISAQLDAVVDACTRQQTARRLQWSWSAHWRRCRTMYFQDEIFLLSFRLKCRIFVSFAWNSWC